MSSESLHEFVNWSISCGLKLMQPRAVTLLARVPDSDPGTGVHTGELLTTILKSRLNFSVRTLLWCLRHLYRNTGQ
jgi:hypothetical protein